jgi:hypothetical protein
MDAFDDRELTCSSRAYAHNVRRFHRVLPSQQVAWVESPRPTSTKYTWLEGVPSSPAAPPLPAFPVFSVEDTFLPSTSRGPWTGYAARVNDESELRNQRYALQSAPQAAYIPSSQSTLFRHRMVNSGAVVQPFPRLFTPYTPDWKPSTHPSPACVFHYDTRQARRSAPSLRPEST